MASVVTNNFVVAKEIGGGGMATVYLARKKNSRKDIALKVLHAALADQKSARERFLIEAALGQKLVHQNIVGVLEVFEDETGAAFSMDYFKAGSLRQYLTSDPRVSILDAVRLTMDIVVALEYAHAQGSVHCDLKPENVYLRDGTAMVGDWGIATNVGHAVQAKELGTQGTPAFMSPEQIRGEPVDPRSDIYSVGLVLWTMLTGRSPWAGESLSELLKHQQFTRLPPIRQFRDGIPDRLNDVVMRAVEKRASARWQDMSALRNALSSAVPELSESKSATRLRRSAPTKKGSLSKAALVVAGGGLLIVAGSVARSASSLFHSTPPSSTESGTRDDSFRTNEQFTGAAPVPRAQSERTAAIQPPTPTNSDRLSVTAVPAPAAQHAAPSIASEENTTYLRAVQRADRLKDNAQFKMAVELLQSTMPSLSDESLKTKMNQKIDDIRNTCVEFGVLNSPPPPCG